MFVVLSMLLLGARQIVRRLARGRHGRRAKLQPYSPVPLAAPHRSRRPLSKSTAMRQPDPARDTDLPEIQAV